MQLGGLEMHSSGSWDQEPRAILWIAWGHSRPRCPGGTLCHAPPLPLHPPGAGKKGLELGWGSSSLSRHSPQQHSHPNGSSSLSRRAFLVLEEAEEAGQAVTPLCPPQNPKKEREGEPRRVRMSRDTLGDFQGWNHTWVGKPRPWKSF